MKKILMANGVWDLIEGTSTSRETDIKRDSSASAYLFQGLPEDLLMQVAGCGTAKEIWDSLKSRFIGTKEGPTQPLAIIKSEFERLMMKEDESIDSFAGKMMGIITKAATCGLTFDEQTKVRKIMSSLKDDLVHLKIPFEDILCATNSFGEENNICTSGFAKEYKGQLLWFGELIDITARRLNKERDDKDEQQFWMEISMLSSLKHKNLVSLVGFCDENDENIIITRHNTRGSISNYLSDASLLTWVRRLEICVGVAHALSYIHYDESRDFSVIHRNINRGTIILNDNWEPKLCDFERSMKIKASKRHHSFYNGACTYIPEYVDSTLLKVPYTVNHKSDMYSFGIIMFELMCGRRSIVDTDSNKYLAPLALTHYREKRLDEIIDWVLWKQMDSQSFDIFTETVYDCLNEERSQRPNIDEIVMRLEKALELQLEHQKTV
ncbi:kinase-like domain, phloem protein 2-like protein [Tanacetum coccineum]